MKKLMGVMVMTVLILAIIPAASSAALTGQSEHSTSGAVLSSPQSEEVSFEYWGSKIIGVSVKNKEGEYLGRLEDLMIDPQKGQIAFAILSKDGALGIPMKFTAVPFGELAYSAKNHVFLMDASREDIAGAPSFTLGNWPSVTNREWKVDVYKYYGRAPVWGESGESTEPTAQSRGNGGDLFLQIVGKRVTNRGGEALGQIRDIVADSQGHVAFAILSHGGFLGFREKLLAIPFSAMSYNEKGKDLVLNVSKKKLDSAPAFNGKDLPDKTWAENDYRFFDRHPYWTE